LLEFAFDLRLLAVDVAMDAFDDFDATAFDADNFGADVFDAFDATDFSADDFGADAFDAFDATAFDVDDCDAFDATAFGADDFGVDAFDAFDATVACDAFDAVDAPLRTRVILTRLVIGSLRWRLKVGVEMNHRCVDGRK